MRRVALTAVPVPPDMVPRWGRVTADDWHRHYARTGRALAVFVDGVDVSERCVAADDVAGTATLMFLDDQGRARRSDDGSGPVVETVRGAVEIAERGIA